LAGNATTLAVVGAGVMGRGIAKLFANAGIPVTLVKLPDVPGFDHPGVTVSDALPATAPKLVIEAIFEDVGAKRELYAQLESAYGGASVVASNTSGLPLPELEAELRFPEQFLGMHFFHPAEAFPMIEVVRTDRTSDAATDVVLDIVARAGREPVLLERPIVGYVVNRLQHAILHEAYHLLASGIANAATIDDVAKKLLGPRMTITGLLEQKDLAGIEIHANAQRSIVPNLAHTGVPNPLVQEMAARGDVGIRSGRGFYDWSERDGAATARDAQVRLERLLRFLDDELGASAE
jgi:3-hydroxybutyryl-CoA dehydrogenase